MIHKICLNEIQVEVKQYPNISIIHCPVGKYSFPNAVYFVKYIIKDIQSM